MEENEQDDPAKLTSSYAKYSAIAFQMAIIIGGFTYAGYKIDQSAHHDTQWVTAFLSLTGVCLSIYFTIRQLKK